MTSFSVNGIPNTNANLNKLSLPTILIGSLGGSGIPANSVIQFTITLLKNPSSQQPTSQFIITNLDESNTSIESTD